MKKTIQVIYNHYDINSCRDEYKATFSSQLFELELNYVREDFQESVLYNTFNTYNKQLDFKQKKNNWFHKKTGELYRSFDLKPLGGWTVEGFSSRYEFVERCENFKGFEVIKLKEIITSPFSPDGRTAKNYYYLIKIDPINEFFTKEELNYCSGKLIFRHLDDIPSEYSDFNFLYKIDRIETVVGVHTGYEITDISVGENP